MPKVGIEPTRAQSSLDFESSASTSFTTPASSPLLLLRSVFLRPVRAHTVAPPMLDGAPFAAGNLVQHTPSSTTDEEASRETGAGLPARLNRRRLELKFSLP